MTINPERQMYTFSFEPEYYSLIEPIVDRYRRHIISTDHVNDEVEVTMDISDDGADQFIIDAMNDTSHTRKRRGLLSRIFG